MNETQSIFHTHIHQSSNSPYKVNKPKLVIFNLLYSTVEYLCVEHTEEQKKNLSKCHNSIQLLTVIIGFRSPLPNNSIFKFDGNTYTFHLEVNPSVCLYEVGFSVELYNWIRNVYVQYLSWWWVDIVYASYAIIKCTYSQFVTSNCFFLSCVPIPICPYNILCVTEALCIVYINTWEDFDGCVWCTVHIYIYVNGTFSLDMDIHSNTLCWWSAKRKVSPFFI